jgi:hypothetical protein
MKFWLVIKKNGSCTVGIDNANVSGINNSGLPANIYMITYEDRQGRIAYRDRQQIGYPFFDPTWIVPYVEQALLVLSKRDPPLLLEQAQSIKLELVDAQHNAKRQAPIGYLNREWATDDDTHSVMSTMFAGDDGIDDQQLYWYAIGVGQPVQLTRGQLVEMLQEIVKRNRRLFQIRQLLAAAIYARNSVADVIAVDLVKRW